MKKIITILTLVFLSNAAMSAQIKTDINSKQASTMIAKDNKIIVLDVRTPEEFSAGHIKGAINIDIRQTDAFSKINRLNKNSKYIVHCRTNRRSAIAVDYMMKNGFKSIFQISDGFSGWEENKLPKQK